jgi:hypothetical protein
MVAGGGIKSKVDFRIRIEPRTSRARREHEYRTATFNIQIHNKKLKNSFVNGGLGE